MKDKRILYVSSEVIPYLPETEISSMSFEAPRMVNKQGGQIRIFMPRYGNINERRHQLHEVIRLSGINLVVNDLDMPLIIKVASIPKERIQVYFIDNEEYFKRKSTFLDSNGKLFEDNEWKATSAYRSGDYEKAAEQFAKKDNTRANFNRGNALAFAGRLQDAIDSYEKVLSKSSNKSTTNP